MTHLPGGRQSSPHLRLSPAEVKRLWECGYYTPKGYLYHLILAHRKPGWTWKIDNVSQFCKDWDIARSTFYKAKGALVTEGAIDENIIGSVELTVISTNECTQPETPVSDPGLTVSNRGQSVSDPGLTVSNRGQSALESIGIQEVCDPTSLSNFKTPTTQDVCVSEDKVSNEDPEVRTEVGVSDRPPAQVKNADPPTEALPPEQETYAPPILLAAKKKFQLNLGDASLRRAIERWPERVEVAIACLEEKQLTVKYPTRFLHRAIEEDWKPEKRTGGSEWRNWFNEAYNRGLVSAGREEDGVQYVLTADDHWVPFEHLRRQSWDELEAQLKPITVEAQAAPDELTQAQIIEAVAVLVGD